jgi:anhydro-N-acetylmuramic acid kinase
MATIKKLNVLGLNSGTSMDGIDTAIFAIGPRAGSQAGGKGGQLPPLTIELLTSELVEFDPVFKKQLTRLVAEGETSLRTICLLNAALGEVFADACNRAIKSARGQGISVDLIGSHGQTIWHCPEPGQFGGRSVAGSLQLGDPAVIAVRTSVTTVGDFRTADLALGGQGAPLTSFADQVIFGEVGHALGVLNLGGIANITVIDHHGRASMAFDTGPANVLIDEAVRILFNKEYDSAGQIAAGGRVSERHLKQILDLPYFKMQPPKTTGRELFGRTMAERIVEQWLAEDLKAADIIATLTALTARSVAQAYIDFVAPQVEFHELVVGGGGEANDTLMKGLVSAWPGDLKLLRHEDFGVTPKFKEALLFALLAYTNYFGIANNVPACTGASRPAVLGKLVHA